MAVVRQIVLGRFLGQAHDFAQPRLDGFRRAEGGHGFGRSGAAHQIVDRALLARAQAEALDIGDQAGAARAFRIRQQAGERGPRQLLLGAALDRLEAGGDARFLREARKQRLGEAVDGLNAQAPRRIEHPREQAPGALAHRRTDIGAQRREVLGQSAVLHPHPGGELGSDAVGHFGGPGLGEGQAEDALGRCPVEQQPQHPPGQHLGLARTGRGRKGGMDARINRRRLGAVEHRQPFAP